MRPTSVKETDDRQLARILEGLGSREPQDAWAEFLQSYSPLILQVVRLFETEDDPVADCFLFVCEQLSCRQFRRLRRFRLAGSASFSTWIRAVVRNLCLDWRRREFGRQRIFQSIARLSSLDREVFRCVYEQGMPSEDTFLTLKTRFSTLTREQLQGSLERIRQALTPRQFWLLSTRKPRVEPLECAQTGDVQTPREQIPDPAPNPEAVAALSERRAAVVQAITRLPKPDRLLIRLRYGQELTLEQVARVTGLKDAQSADRRIKEILDRLRKDLVQVGGRRPNGKIKLLSV